MVICPLPQRTCSPYHIPCGLLPANLIHGIPFMRRALDWTALFDARGLVSTTDTSPKFIHSMAQHWHDEDVRNCFTLIRKGRKTLPEVKWHQPDLWVVVILFCCPDRHISVMVRILPQTQGYAQPSPGSVTLTVYVWIFRPIHLYGKKIANKMRRLCTKVQKPSLETPQKDAFNGELNYSIFIWCRCFLTIVQILGL